MDKIWYRKSFEVRGHWLWMKKGKKSTYSAACQFDIMF